MNLTLEWEQYYQFSNFYWRSNCFNEPQLFWRKMSPYGIFVLEFCKILSKIVFEASFFVRSACCESNFSCYLSIFSELKCNHQMYFSLAFVLLQDLDSTKLKVKYWLLFKFTFHAIVKQIASVIVVDKAMVSNGVFITVKKLGFWPWLSKKLNFTLFIFLI